jgi:CheY-like chemotaxis protein
MGDTKTAHIQGLDLNGARILVVEDEYYIADDLRRILASAGAEVVGPVSTVSKAVEVIERGEFDCAVLDLNLHGSSAVPVADRLLAAGKSFAIATGYAISALPEWLRNVPRIEKPFDPPALLQLVRQLRCAKEPELPS